MGGRVLSTATSSVEHVLGDLVQRGIQLKVADGRLQFWPRSALTSERIWSLKQHKSQLIQILQGSNRWRAAQMIRAARRSGDRGYAITLRDAWRERVAICVISGNSPLQEAYQIAMVELESVTYSKT